MSGSGATTHADSTYEGRQIFPAPGLKLEPNDGAAVRMEGDVAVVDVAPEHGFGGAKFVLCEPFALNPYKTLSVEVSNRTARALNFGFYGIHRGNTTWYAPQRFRLEPNQAKAVAAPNRLALRLTPSTSRR